MEVGDTLTPAIISIRPSQNQHLHSLITGRPL